MKPTTEQILSALNKLVKENKTELKAEKVELGLVDDLKRSLNSLAADSQIMLESYDKTRKLFFDIEGAAKKAKGQIDTNQQVFKSSNTKIDLAEKLLSKIDTAVKELGLNVKDIKEYAEVERGVKLNKDDIKDLITFNKKLQGVT